MESAQRLQDRIIHVCLSFYNINLHFITFNFFSSFVLVSINILKYG